MPRRRPGGGTWLGDKAVAAHAESGLVRLLETIDDAFVRSTGYMAPIEHAFRTDLAAVVPLETWAATTAAPSILALAAFSEGRRNMWATGGADRDAAVASYEKGLTLARSVGDVAAECHNLIGIAVAQLTFDTPEAATANRDALILLLSSRDRQGTRILLGTVVEQLK